MIKNSFKVKYVYEKQREKLYYNLVFDALGGMEAEVDKEDIAHIDLNKDIWVLIGIDTKTGFTEVLDIQNKDFKQTKSRTLVIRNLKYKSMYRPTTSGFEIVKGQKPFDVRGSYGNAHKIEISKNMFKITRIFYTNDEVKNSGRQFINLHYLRDIGGVYVFVTLKKDNKAYFNFLKDQKTEELVAKTKKENLCLMEFEIKDKEFIIHDIIDFYTPQYKRLPKSRVMEFTFTDAKRDETTLEMWFGKNAVISMQIPADYYTEYDTVKCRFGLDFKIIEDK